MRLVQSYFTPGVMRGRAAGERGQYDSSPRCRERANTERVVLDGGLVLPAVRGKPRAPAVGARRRRHVLARSSRGRAHCGNCEVAIPKHDSIRAAYRHRVRDPSDGCSWRAGGGGAAPCRRPPRGRADPAGDPPGRHDWQRVTAQSRPSGQGPRAGWCREAGHGIVESSKVLCEPMTIVPGQCAEM